MEIARIARNGPSGELLARQNQESPQKLRSEGEQIRQNQQKAEREQARSARDLQEYVQELQSITQIFNKKLKFTVNRELDQVVVKVIDGNTDEVIKELPPRELQRLHIRIREAIGLLIDEQI
jgi:flagellar protein FlaG